MEADVQVSAIEPAIAAQLLAGVERFDRNPQGRGDVAALAVDGGHSYALTCGRAQAVYVLKVRGTQVWIEAAYGGGDANWTGIMLPIIERQARAVGADSIGFQTGRAGLLRKAAPFGFGLVGYVARKDLK